MKEPIRIPDDEFDENGIVWIPYGRGGTRTALKIVLREYGAQPHIASDLDEMLDLLLAAVEDPMTFVEWDLQ